MEIGNYTADQHEKGKNEAFIEGIQEGEPFFTVQLDNHSRLDTKSQAEAEILSRLVRIENMLREKEKQ